METLKKKDYEQLPWPGMGLKTKPAGLEKPPYEILSKLHNTPLEKRLLRWEGYYEYQTILDLIKEEKAQKILDCAAGTGILSAVLKVMNYSVEACDINPQYFQADGIVCKKVDLNKNMPYSNDTFDIVILNETLHCLENPCNFIREAKRVLKKSGKLILSFPNTQNFFSRIKFFKKGELMGFHKSALYDRITPVHYWQIENLLQKFGFEIQNIHINVMTKPRRFTNRPFLWRIFCSLVFILPLEPKDKNFLFGHSLILKAICNK